MISFCWLLLNLICNFLSCVKRCFTVAVNIADTKINTSKTEALQLSRSSVQFSVGKQRVIESRGEVQVTLRSHLLEMKGKRK